MALRAGLAIPIVAPQQEWPWHNVTWKTVPVWTVSRDHRRLEAENYLSAGFDIRERFAAAAGGHDLISNIAAITMPNRTKGIIVSSEVGTPFLTATQVFDARPIPRKWLAMNKTVAAKKLLVSAGQILVTRSGSVGRATIGTEAHEKHLISDDLIRVTPNDPEQWGWIYAYLRAPSIRKMMSREQYGHIIKHLEPEHLQALTIPKISAKTAKQFQEDAQEILAARNLSYELTLKAEAIFEKEVGLLAVADCGEYGFTINSRALLGGHRRLDAYRHNPGARSVFRHLASGGRTFTTLISGGFDVWVPGRYKRIPATDGVTYIDSAELLESNPELDKRFKDCSFGDKFGGRVKRGWIVMPCSGQVYGIIGTAVIAGAALEEKAISNHVMRIAPRKDCSMRVGYVATALSHPTLGRPLVKCLAFGSSVPEIDPLDIQHFPVVRLSKKKEDEISDHAEEAAKQRAKADLMEQALADKAEALLTRFLDGDWTGIEGKPKLSIARKP